jgi:hypothetical protein
VLKQLALKQLPADDIDDAVVISSLPHFFLPCMFSITSLLGIIFFCL